MEETTTYLHYFTSGTRPNPSTLTYSETPANKVYLGTKRRGINIWLCYNLRIPAAQLGFVSQKLDLVEVDREPQLSSGPNASQSYGRYIFLAQVYFGKSPSRQRNACSGGSHATPLRAVFQQRTSLYLQ